MAELVQYWIGTRFFKFHSEFDKEPERVKHFVDMYLHILTILGTCTECPIWDKKSKFFPAEETLLLWNYWHGDFAGLWTDMSCLIFTPTYNLWTAIISHIGVYKWQNEK
jgi:hypothetical protein